MAKLTEKEFMDKVKLILGDRNDDDALSFLEDCKDTITSEKDEYEDKYHEAVKEKEELDKMWRDRFRDRFYSDDNPSQEKEKDKGNQTKDPFDNRSEAQIEAENTTIDSLFSESEDK